MACAERGAPGRVSAWASRRARRPAIVCRAALPEGAAAAAARGREAADTRQALFNGIAPRYDALNDLLSAGQHRVWKRAAVKWAQPARGGRALDVCTGTGDLALRLAEAVGNQGEVVALDFAAELLGEAARREAAARAGGGSAKDACRVEWVEGDALALPFADSSFDAATMGYGLRNVTDRGLALQELRRVLRPGGRAAVLDFNNSADPLVSFTQGWILDNVVVPVATSQGLQAEYEYLRPSIEGFPRADAQRRLALDAGFASAVHYELGFGFMGCLVCTA